MYSNENQKLLSTPENFQLAIGGRTLHNEFMFVYHFIVGCHDNSNIASHYGDGRKKKSLSLEMLSSDEVKKLHTNNIITNNNTEVEISLWCEPICIFNSL